MPALPPVPNVSRVVLNFTFAGQRCANVLHYLNESELGSPDAEDVGAAIRSIYNVYGKVHAPATVSLDSITVTPLDPDPAPSVDYVNSLPIVGTNASPALPNNVTVATSFLTPFRGRSFRGRAYWVGLAEGQATDNTLSSTARDGINIFWEQMRVLEAGVGEVNFLLCVVSYYSNNALRAQPIATPVSSVRTEGTIDSQRRRLPGRGR